MATILFETLKQNPLNMMMVVSITWSVFDSGTKFLIGVPEGTEIPLGPSGSAWTMTVMVAAMLDYHNPTIHIHIKLSVQNTWGRP